MSTSDRALPHRPRPGAPVETLVLRDRHPADPDYYTLGKPPAASWPEADPLPSVLSTDPLPLDAPAQPAAVRKLRAEALLAGFEVRVGYSRGQARMVKVGQFKTVEAFGVWGLRTETGWRFVAINSRSPDLKAGWAWDSVAIWLPGQPVAPGLGSRFVEATVTDLREWLGVRGDAGPAWFEAIHARVQEQAERTKARPASSSRKPKEGMA